MRITNKTLQPTVKDALRSLEVKTQCLQFNEEKRFYVRSQISKISKEDVTIKYKTKTEDGMLNVWRIS